MFSGQRKRKIFWIPHYQKSLDDAPTEEKTAYRKACDNNLEVRCLMLACMEPDIQMQFETNHEAHDMIVVL